MPFYTPTTASRSNIENFRNFDSDFLITKSRNLSHDDSVNKFYARDRDENSSFHQVAVF